uniref:Uncharacterized protein, isoform A n=1 Tax=Drosophila melanogaster TaxID=7227 RepID=Q5LJR0_DROME|nr:uncharacterized protein Dmel_CG17715, isoform E [Drosophila melanogaster]NP_001036409.1 uncharacterized protein Dmel_CG17715, isoform A [Drosophila melanogaster]EAA46032.1 uncharacterized protein Dmel_CG17715, isoform E [Drosophila melanogaster]EAA46033.2 uncharacterized protein Dmel_CG17715, isoform A [Drosophila melanogaster]|eukprot:NP_001036407.1 uncharacterized protein Dmel_CG17715, isoform E [Drosophila melanogaster]
MRNKFQSAIRGVTRQYIIRSWPRGRELLRTQLIIPPSSTSSPFTCRNYSKFSTHLSMERALELLCNLDDEERGNLRSALGRLDADKEKKLYESQLAFGSWRTRFGRLSNKTELGQVIAGTFCAVPDDWLRKKLGK